VLLLPLSSRALAQPQLANHGRHSSDIPPYLSRSFLIQGSPARSGKCTMRYYHHYYKLHMASLHNAIHGLSFSLFFPTFPRAGSTVLRLCTWHSYLASNITLVIIRVAFPPYCPPRILRQRCVIHMVPIPPFSFTFSLHIITFPLQLSRIQRVACFAFLSLLYLQYSFPDNLIWVAVSYGKILA